MIVREVLEHYVLKGPRITFTQNCSVDCTEIEAHALCRNNLKINNEKRAEFTKGNDTLALMPCNWN